MGFFSSLFGGSKKRDTTYTGPKPYGTLREAAGGEETYQELKRRLAGQGVGYGDSYADLAASPVIARMSDTYRSQVLPELKSELSVTGRRKGSAGFDQLRRSLTEQKLAEGDVWSNLFQKNEDQKRAEINAALSGLGDYASKDAGLRSELSAFENANNNRQIAEESQRQANKSAGLQRLLTAGGSLIAAPFTGGASLAGLAPITSTSSGSYNPNDPRNYVGYGRSGNSMSQRLALRAALSGGYR